MTDVEERRKWQQFGWVGNEAEWRGTREGRKEKTGVGNRSFFAFSVGSSAI